MDDERWEKFSSRRGRFHRNLAVLDATLVRTSSGDRVPASQLLRQPDVRLADLIAQERRRTSSSIRRAHTISPAWKPR